MRKLSFKEVITSKYMPRFIWIKICGARIQIQSVHLTNIVLCLDLRESL